jgi:tetraacyldisaccharide-1-P 4'-kinase
VRPPFDRAVAFCGLGNPAAFWVTLEDLPLAVPARIAYRDHYVYQRGDLEHIAGRARELGVAALVTTEKDAMNLPPRAAEMVAPARIFVLRIEIEVDDGDRLVDAVVAARPEMSRALRS